MGGFGFGGGFDFNNDGKMNPAESMAEMDFVIGSHEENEDFDYEEYETDLFEEKAEEKYYSTKKHVGEFLNHKITYENLELMSLINNDYKKCKVLFLNELKNLEGTSNLIEKNEDYHKVVEEFLNKDITNELGEFWLYVIKAAFEYNQYKKLFRVIESYNSYALSYSEYISEVQADKTIIQSALIDMEELRRKFVFYCHSIHDKQILPKEKQSFWIDNIDRLLAFKKIKWEYRTETILIDDIDVFIPDFILEDKSIICILNSWDLSEWKYIWIFKERFPDRKVIVIDPDIYFLLNKTYKDIIPNWKNEDVPTFDENIQVVGIGYYNRQGFVDRLKPGEKLTFIREPQNAYDKNAIKTLDKTGNQIGYVSKNWAMILAHKIDEGVRYRVVINKKSENSINCNVSLVNPEDLVLPEMLRTLR